jgi:hypothetical protein
VDKGANFEIIVDGKTRSYRDIKEVALEAARYLKSRKGNNDVKVRDLTTGEVIAI